MRIHIIVEQMPDGGARFHRMVSALGEKGWQVVVEHRVPERSLDPGELLLIDARRLPRAALRKLTELADRRALHSRVIALTRRGEAMLGMSALLRAGVSMVVPFDEADAETPGGFGHALELLTAAIDELRQDAERRRGPSASATDPSAAPPSAAPPSAAPPSATPRPWSPRSSRPPG